MYHKAVRIVHSFISLLISFSRLAAALELEKVSREREIESLHQRQSEAERGTHEVLSHAVESAETQRREYEDRLKQLQSELAEHQLKVAQLERNQQLLTTATEYVQPETQVTVCAAVVLYSFLILLG